MPSSDNNVVYILFKKEVVEKRVVYIVKKVQLFDGYRKTPILTLQVSNSTRRAEVSNNVHDKQISVQ